MVNKLHTVHFVGIKGVGMAPLAIIAKEAGIIVSGSDVSDEYITDTSLQKVGITPLIGFSVDHIGDVDLVITTGAHGGFDNVEVKAAKEKNIPVVSQGETVGIFMQGDVFGREQNGISIFGSHGKTTTTAMIATILQDAGLDPSYVIGTSDIPSLGGSGHYGKGDYFIAEADEYATEPTYDKTPKLLWQHPKIAVCTNIELDHPDMYKSVTEVTAVYTQFIKDLPDDGICIANGDDSEVQKMLAVYSGKKKTFGLHDSNDYQITDIIVEKEKTTFSITEKGQVFGKFAISAIGEHNALNATAAILTALAAGVDITAIKKGISTFTGSKRRLEYIQTTSSGALLYDDYAHHPTEVAASLKALAQSYPQKHIICIFQPHTYSRTKVLFTEFSHAFSYASQTILTDIYASQREAADPTVKIEDLARQINENGVKCLYLPKPIDVVKYLQAQRFGEDTLLVTMGAGDIYKIGKDLR